MKNSTIISGVCAIAVACSFWLSSCAPARQYYQVYAVKSIDVPQNSNNGFVYENDDVELTYDFCCRGGDVSFLCHNKTDKILYISMPNSFYINNGIAYDYYKDCDYTSTVSSMSSSKTALGTTESTMASVTGALTGKVPAGDGYYIGTVGATLAGKVSRTIETAYSNTNGRSQSITTHAPRIIVIPPHSAKLISGFSIRNEAYMQCGEELYEENYPKKVSKMLFFDKDNTPLVFRNHISYSFDQDCTNLKQIENTFYIASMQNRNEKEVKVKNPAHVSLFDPDTAKTKRDACYKEPSRYIFTITAPNVFYNVFEKEK